MFRSTTKRILIILFFTALSLGQGAQSWASVTSVMPTPSLANVPVSQASNRTVSWTVTSTLPPGTIISSTQGRFLADGIPIATNGMLLTKPLGPTGTASMTENVRIPAGLMQEAVSRGATLITYERGFSDSPTAPPRIASITLVPVGASSADFGVSRLELTFDDNTLVRVIKRNDSLKARLRINYAGSGLLQGAWQIADSTSLDGQAFFRTLRSVHQNIMGGRQAFLVSPELPSNITGTYTVRFVISNPDYRGQIPALNYRVENSGIVNSGIPIKIIKLLSPSSGASLTPETVFSWSPIEGALSYRLELFELDASKAPPLLADVTTEGLPQISDSKEDGSTPLGGIYVLAETHETSLKAMTLAMLDSGETYKWRVLALNGEGIILGKSAFFYTIKE